MRLDAIVDYNMDVGEAKAYKLTLLWIELSRKAFPDYKHARVLTKGDPRKGLIFKICYKLQRETQGILEEKDYPLYIRAQLEILKHLTRGNTHALIDPNCLIGEKAWIRWKLWKKKYEQVSQQCESKASVPLLNLKVADSLQKTKEFLVKTFGPEISTEKIQEAFVNKNLHNWIKMGKISPYFLVLSPLLNGIAIDSLANLDLDVYRQAVNPDTKTIYEKIFNSPRPQP